MRALLPNTAAPAGDNRLLATLPTETMNSLQPEMKCVVLAQGTILLEPGDAVEHIYFPHTGLISLMIVAGNGENIESAAIGREGALGLHRGFGARRSLTRASVQVDGTFSTIAAARFEQIVNDSPPLQRMIARYTEVLWAEAQQSAACNAAHDSSTRLCRWLLQCADRAGRRTLPLTQEFLAQMLGIRRTTVTVLARALQAKNLIRYSRGHIIILDRKGLEACACECYRVIRPDTLALTLGIKL
jgi:CRP-like cAMP-binding protein